MHADPQNEALAVREVLSYFVRNPNAADDLEGIARWRVLEEIARRRIEDTRHALKWLVEEGYLRETLVAGWAPIFKINSDRLEQAKAYLARDPPCISRRKGGGICES
jgi:hypothetical protein